MKLLLKSEGQVRNEKAGTTVLIQQKLVSMFKALHKVLEEHGFEYYVLGGTALGTTRHRGFIPWDDDIDIGMPRETYDRFVRVSEQILPSSLKILSMEKDIAFLYLFAKLYDVATTLVENTDPPFVGGVYIDIFPIDGCGRTTIPQARAQYKKFRILNFLAYVAALGGGAQVPINGLSSFV